MKIMVSACLLGENCKYNGGSNRNENVLKFVEGHTVISVCPEVLGGLPTPRIPSEIVNGIVTNKEGIVVDEEFRKGAKEALNRAESEKIDLCILKAGSPSCGCSYIYDGTFSGTRIEGSGIFAGMMIERGYKVVDENHIHEL